ncbi:unnamed protein product [Owenia fusiformis]|uniref:Coiled-coil domain-containing protein 13 n=1 Tax=Owenia fusiformis TaxID=6347 RepID=A0A8S4N2U1_OWEFU|nr:unnamed protein product [Owenia fusiformis]
MGDSEALKQQFALLQEQQQKKLSRMKQRKEQKEKKDDSPEKKDETNLSSSFGIDDNLGLKLSEPPPTTDGIYSEELVTHLNEQIRELKDESGRLYKLLTERDFEIRKLKKKQEDHKLALSGGGVAKESAATKIVDLSKKVRELTAEAESERTKARQYNKKCHDLENQLVAEKKNKSSHSSIDDLPPDLAERVQLQNDVKSLQERLKQSESRCTDFRNQCQLFKKDLTIAQKVLTSELGDNVNIQALLKEPSDFKGRSQQISILKKQVAELKLALGQTNRSPRPATQMTDDLEAEFMGSAVSTRSMRISDKQRDTIRKMEKDRKESAEMAVAELKALEGDHAALKQKFDALKARNKVLSNDNKSMKSKMQTCIDKGKHDDELIQALMNQQSHLQNLLDQSTKLQQSAQNQQEAKMRELSMRTQQDNNVVDKLKAIIAAKEEKVDQLEQEMKKMQLHQAQINGVNSLFDKPPYSSRGRPPSSQNLPVEMDDGMAPYSPTPPLSQSRLSQRSSSRQSSSDLERPGSGRKQPTGPTRPASTGSAGDRKTLEELENLRLQYAEVNSLFQATQVERDKLRELLQIQQKRVDEATEKYSSSQSDLVEQRRRNVQLEKLLGKSKLEQEKQAKSGGKKGKNKSATSLRESLMDDPDLPSNDTQLEELQVSLDIQKDENDALKEALQSTLRAKEEDLKLYHDMMEETKHVFLTGLRQYRQNQT